MRENRERWLQEVKKQEAGWADHPDDNGGPCMFGVTLPALSSWRRRECTVEDLKALTWEEAADLYSGRYWNAVGGDDLPGGLDVVVADACVNSGNRRASLWLQSVLGTEVDGYVGPKTIEGARKADTATTIRSFSATRLAFLQTLKDWPVFGKGWSRRVAEVEELGLSLVKPITVEAKAPAAAAEGGIIGIALAIIAQMGPELLTSWKAGGAAVDMQDWSFVGISVAAVAGAGWRFYSRRQKYLTRSTP